MSLDPHLRRVILILAILFGLSITVLSLMPNSRIAFGTRTHSPAPGAIHRAARHHIFVHVAGFGALACATWFSAKGGGGKLAALALALLFGFGTEYAEHRVYHSVLELNDVFTNVMTIVAVFCLLEIMERRIRRSPSQNIALI